MATEPKTSAKVCVACKLPHGLKIQFYITKPNVPPVVDGEAILLAGSNSDNASAQGGYGITPGVDAARFGRWLTDNQDFPAVKAGLIFAEDTYDKARDRAREQSAIRSGFEGLNAEQPGNGVQVDNYEGRPARP